MVRRLIDHIRRSLAKKITAWVMVSLFLLIMLIITGAHWITTNFYQDHLRGEVQERLAAHEILLGSGGSADHLRYLNQLETGKNSHLILTDDQLEPVFMTENVTADKVAGYLNFLQTFADEREPVDTGVFVDEVETSMLFHIPHIWGATGITDDAGNVTGYLFIDQDTGELNSARLNLVILLLAVGGVTLVVGFLFVSYLTNRVADPLEKMSERTQDIAEGDFDVVVDVHGKDEVGRLGGNIQQMTRQLKEYRDSRQQFISHVSHDLRTPITYIKGYSALMKDAAHMDADSRQHHLRVIYEEAKRMERLVTDLFLLTKLQEGRIQLKYEEVEVGSWLKELLDSRAIMFDQKNISPVLTIDESLENKSVRLDKFRIGQALINLLENAIRFTEVEGKVSLSAAEKDRLLIFEVADTGPGMDNDQMEKVWERFYKADPARSRNDSGTGLGLAIVKEIIEAHGGWTDVKSEEGEGAAFYLSIPLNSP